MMMDCFMGARMGLCGESICSYQGMLIISINLLLIAAFVICFCCKVLRRRGSLFRLPSNLRISCLGYNGCIGIVYVSLGLWQLGEKLKWGTGLLPLGWWVVLLIQGVASVVIGLVAGIRTRLLGVMSVRIWSGVACLLAVFVCTFSFRDFVVEKRVSIKLLNVLTLPGAIMLLFCAFKSFSESEDSKDMDGDSLWMPLNGRSNGNTVNYDESITPFARAGFLSRMTFWWLNSVMKRGYEKPLEEKDIPQLGEVDRAEGCYSLFLQQLNKDKQIRKTSSPSFLWTIVSCYKTEIIVSGFFALLKVLTLSAGPVLLKAFIKVSIGEEDFRYEGFVLALVMFISKCLESMSQRQWYFRTRLIGLRVRSLLSTAIYQKQVKLSNSSKLAHSSGEIMNYVTVDAYRIGEFPYWFHQTWTTSLQLCIALLILYNAVGLATIAALVVIILTVLCNAPLAKLQHKFQSKLMEAQDARLKAMSEALVNMKVLKPYAWETHFKKVIEELRTVELHWLAKVQFRRASNTFLFWSSPVLVSAATFLTCYFIDIPLYSTNVFTFVAALRLVQDPVRQIPEVIGVVIQAKVAFSRIVNFLEAPELQNGRTRRYSTDLKHPILLKSATFSWDGAASKSTLSNINVEVKEGEKVAICGKVGSGKSTLLAAILGEIPNIEGTVHVCGRTAYVSQNAWIQTGTIQENILFGSAMDKQRYQETLENCSLSKDLEMLPFGDLIEIGERGVNLSGGQKQRIQLARALYQDADIYLLDDPFSAVDAHTATSLFNDYVMGALSSKTVLLVTHQVDFLPVFNSILLMSDGEILHAAPYHELLVSSKEFQDLVNAHKDTVGTERPKEVVSSKNEAPCREINGIHNTKQIQTVNESRGDQLTKKEERESGDTGLKPYLQYLGQNKGFIYGSLAALSYAVFIAGQISQNSWMAANVENPEVSSDLSIIDLDVPFYLIFSFCATMSTYCNLGVLAFVTWQVLFVTIPMIFLTLQLQRYYFASSKQLMRVNGTTRSLVANHLAESIAGKITIRAFGEQDRFFAKYLELIDKNASPFFHNFAATEWLIQRLETMSAVVLSSSAFVMALLPRGTFSSGFVGMALSYGLSLNNSLVFSIQNQCILANNIIYVERINQYMHIESEAPDVIEENRPAAKWPAVGRVELCDLQIRYRPDSPLVLRGITCTFEGGHKIGIVGRTGSGKTTLIGALFRLVEPAGGKIIIDGLNIATIGLHDLRSRFGIIPQEPTLFQGSVRYNLDPLGQHTDPQIWEVLDKCQLREAVEEKEGGLESLVVEEGSNWSMGQRQLFCLGRALLRRSRILVLDEATASIDNTTDAILQKTIRAEFEDCTVITVAHRIPTVMDCTRVLGISDGKLVEYDEPVKLMQTEGSLFRELVQEYWSHTADANIQSRG